MKINLEIIEAHAIFDKEQIDELNTKTLVPKMTTRRRLTRASKIAIYLADKVNFDNGRIVYGNAYGEALSTVKILDSIKDEEAISPTVFQNSTYNTAVSYLSILTQNKHELMTLSSGDTTSLNILKAGAIKALDGDTLLLLATETLNIQNIEELNTCIEYLECGVALKVKVTSEEANISYMDFKNTEKFPPSLNHMICIAQNFKNDASNVIEVNL